MNEVIIYTDGACIGNPGPGGYGVVLEYGGRRRELSGGYRRTTNNRMELLGVIRGLEELKERAAVQVYTDSSYIVNAMRTGAAQRWRQAAWKRKDGTVPNADLWERLLDLAAGHFITFEWVPGHSGIPQNERCDRLAQAAARGSDLLDDSGFEAER
jgi:ribonuclease HI